MQSVGPGVYFTKGGIIDEVVLYSRRSVKIKLVDKTGEMVPHWTSNLHRSTSLLSLFCLFVCFEGSKDEIMIMTIARN